MTAIGIDTGQKVLMLCRRAVTTSLRVKRKLWLVTQHPRKAKSRNRDAVTLLRQDKPFPQLDLSLLPHTQSVSGVQGKLHLNSVMMVSAN